MPRDRLPVYLVHHDAPHWLTSSVTSILTSDTRVAVTVVNNGPQQLDLGPGIRVIPVGRNAGYAGAANIAIREWLAGPAPYAVIGSHDLHVGPNAMGRLVAAADRTPEVGILGPMLSTNAVGGARGEHDGLDLRSMVSGTCLLLRRECIASIGGFDELFGSYGEDDELCARAWRAGWLVGRVPGATGHGLGSAAANSLRRHRYPNVVLLAYRTRGWAGTVRVLLGHLHMALVAARRRDWEEVRLRALGITIGVAKAARAVRRAPGSPR